jgi:hypothetical protein
MKKRRFKRYIARFHLVVLAKGKSYVGSLENVSEEGLACIISSVNKPEKDLIPEEKIKLIISSPTGDTFSLNCEIKWTNSHFKNEYFCIGAKIIGPTEKYKEFVKYFD